MFVAQCVKHNLCYSCICVSFHICWRKINLVFFFTSLWWNFCSNCRHGFHLYVMYTTILIAFLCYTDGGKSYIFKDIANYYFLLKVSLIFFFRPSLIFCIHVFLVSCVWISRMNFSPHMPSLYISESFWISSVCFFLLSLNVCLCSYDFGLHFV